MDPANLGVVLDSSIVIEAERQQLDAARFLRHIAGKLGEREAALCAISVAELAHGIQRADIAARRQARRAFLDDLKAAVPVYPITGETAELASCRSHFVITETKNSNRFAHGSERRTR